MLSYEEYLLRLAVAAILGALIGLDRERLDRAAGLRTHALVATASALIMLVSAYGFEPVTAAGQSIVADPSRVAAQVVSGIGFLGAGTIILRRNVIRGLTTAASIWAVAGIGLAVGVGMYGEAVATTAILLLILVGLKPLERRMFTHKRSVRVLVRMKSHVGQIGVIESYVAAAGLELVRAYLEPGGDGEETVVGLELRRTEEKSLAEFADRIGTIPGVQSVVFTPIAAAGAGTLTVDADEDDG